MNKPNQDNLIFRKAELEDLEELRNIEQACFDYDRLNRRSLRRWIQAEHGIFQLIQQGNKLLGYGLVWCHKGTRLARLYSLALLPETRGQGLASKLLTSLEEETADRGHLFMRLEVAKNNVSAIRLYERNGYRVFGEYSDYYDDHSDALRMQKVIQTIDAEGIQRMTPWYRQTTEFTCGPASLMMAMASLDQNLQLDQSMELDIWREATTIFMTAGHGGCHPLGLALAAQKRGFKAKVYINTTQPLFLDGVRSEHKKDILALVHQQYVQKLQNNKDITLYNREINQQQLEDWLQRGYAVVMLISTYRRDGKKAPHWVTVTGIDERCLYVHDPDHDDLNQLAIDCQYLPIARPDFNQMSAFGVGRLRTALAIKPL